MITLKFEGGAELATALDQLSTRLSKSVMREALIAAAEPIRAAAAAKAPHEPGSPDLKENIGISPIRSPEMAAIAVGPTREFFYGFFQEYGTKHHGAQPFMRPAFDTEAPKSLAILSAEAWRLLAARGIGRFISSPTPIQSSGRLL